MDSPEPVPHEPAMPANDGAHAGTRWGAGVVARLRLGAGAVVVLLLLALAVAVLVSLLTPTGASATLERPLAPQAGTTTSPITNQPAAAGMGTTSPRTSPAGGAAGTEPGAPDRPLFVHVLGSVAVPGLYELPVGARVVDAVAAAGGLASEADQARINLARTVTDGEQLYVPAIGEVVAAPAAPPIPAQTGPGATGGDDATEIVNLNTATVDDLDTLPRIGPEMAQRILDWRAANGRFTAPEDLLDVPGIGDRTFEGLRERVAV